MFSIYLTAIIVTAVVLGLQYIVFEQIDDETSKQVLFKGLSNEHPIFAHRGGAHDAPENTVVAIREVFEIMFTTFLYDICMIVFGLFGFVLLW